MTGDAFDELDFEYATAVAEKAMRVDGAAARAADAEQFHTSGSIMCSARSPELKRAIDILIGNKRKFDAATNRDLYAMLCRPESRRRGCRL